MGGVAALARASGHRVTGCDRNVYPPMSTQLKELGIEIHEGVDAQQLEIDPDCVVVGNVMSRGVDVVEAMLNNKHRYTSGPQWLAENVLHDRHVIAVAGTHGKTTTASMLAWILELTKDGLSCMDCNDFEMNIDNDSGSFNMKIDEKGVHIEIQEDSNERTEVKIDKTGVIVKCAKYRL